MRTTNPIPTPLRLLGRSAWLVACGLVLVAGVAGAAPEKVAGGIRFTYADPNANAVSWAGDFNGWNAGANPMSRGADGVWSVVLALPAGSHQYKFVVDGNWVADPENPVTKGSYGNSAVEVGADGSLVELQATSNTRYSPKIFMGGRFIGRFVDTWNEQDERFELRRPEFDLDLEFRTTISEVLQAHFLMNLNAEAEDVPAYRSRLNFDRGSLLFTKPGIEILAYDNEAAGQWDDPLHLLGSVGIYDHPFGYGKQGFRLRTPALGFETELHYADDFETGGTDYPPAPPLTPELDLTFSVPSGSGYRLSPGSWAYLLTIFPTDNNEDTGALRILRRFGETLRLGALGRADRGFNLGYLSYAEATGESTLVVARGQNYQAWYAYGLEARLTPRPGLAVYSEVLYGTHRLLLTGDARIQHWHADTIDSVGVTSATLLSEEPGPGEFQTIESSGRARAGADWTFAEGDITVRADVEHEWHEGDKLFAESDRAMTVWRLGWDRDWRYYLNRPVRTGLAVEVHEFDYDPWLPWASQLWFPTFNFWLESGEHEVGVDRLVMLGQERVVSVRPSLEVPILKRRNLTFRWDGRFNSVDFGTLPKYMESLFRLGVDLRRDLRLTTDSRWVKYDDPQLELFDGYVSHYVEAEYRFAPDVRLALGWGVDPWVIDPPVNEYRYIGRDRFLFDRGANGAQAETDYYGLGPKIAAAEQALRDAKVIQLKAVIRF